MGPPLPRQQRRAMLNGRYPVRYSGRYTILYYRIDRRAMLNSPDRCAILLLTDTTDVLCVAEFLLSVPETLSSQARPALIQAAQQFC